MDRIKNLITSELFYVAIIATIFLVTFLVVRAFGAAAPSSLVRASDSAPNYHCRWKPCILYELSQPLCLGQWQHCGKTADLVGALEQTKQGAITYECGPEIQCLKENVLD